MSVIQMAVPVDRQHTYVETALRGDNMDQHEKYAATYQFGNTKVNIVAPPPQTQQEIDAILREYHMAGWAIIREIQAKSGVAED